MLKELSPELLTEKAPFSKDFPPPFWQLETAKNGELTAKENNIFLHSAYNPSREADTIKLNKEVLEKGTTIFFGMGLGYQIAKWAEAFSQSKKKLVIIEPDLSYFIAAMCFSDFSRIFEVKRLVLAVCCPIEQIIYLIEDSSKINVGKEGVSDSFLFINKVFTNHAMSYFNEVKEILLRNKRKNEINEATLKKFGKLWCKNSVNNIEQMAFLPYISNFNKTDLPFLILGAGPTLNDVLDFLPSLKYKVITVCVETALHALLKKDFQPDFIILTDPQYWAYRHIASLAAPKSFLITEISAYPAVFRFNCKRIILCASQFPVGKYFEKKLGLTIGDLGTGGSVICSAWNLAEFFGAKKIFTAGMDMGFPGKQTHIKGSTAEQTYHTLSNKISTAEKFTTATISNANAQNSENYLGQKILTDSRMKLFAWWLEARMAACPNVKTYSLSEKSLYIPGTSFLQKEARNGPAKTRCRESSIMKDRKNRRAAVSTSGIATAFSLS